MRARIGGGIAGWLIGVVPLIVVNVLDYEGLFDLQDAVIAGLVALIGGVLLGGIASGRLGKRAGGLVSATTSGVVAAFLYAATLIGLVLGASYLDFAPSLIARHPLRVSMAILFIAAVLLAVAIATGVLAGRGAHGVDTGQPGNRSTSLPRNPQPHIDGRYAGPTSHPNQRQPWTQTRPRASSNDEVYGGNRVAADTSDYGRGYGSRGAFSRPLPSDASDPRYAASPSRSAGFAGSLREAHQPSQADRWPPSGR